MRNFYRRAIAFLCLFAITAGLAACGPEQKEDYYPDYPLAKNDGTPSWEQGEKSDLTINWYVDRSTFSWGGSEGSDVSERIYERTGIRIKFQTPLNDDGTMLNSILNSDQMPDLVTVSTNNTTKVQMAEEGYVYSLDGLAKRWAPTLMDNFPAEIRKLYAARSGDLYGLPSLYYSFENRDAFEKQGTKLQANAAFIARKDYLDWYTSAYPDADSTTPQGLIEMCKKVKERYNLTYTIATDAFTTTADNTGLYRLAQYFAVPRENPDGTLTYLEAQEGFYDCLEFLNECYREGLIADTNFSNTKAQQNALVSSGKCFLFFGVPQDYGTAIKEFARTSDTQYTGIVFTNENRDAPVIADLSGQGDMYTMVTKDCKRPDRVIKLIDYLTSPEGELLCYFGIEGKHWDYTIKPGETVVGGDGVSRTYVYGSIMWNDETFEKIFNKNYTSLGILAFQLLCIDKAQKKLATFSGDEMYNWATYLVYNCKAVVSDWLYSPKPFIITPVRDASQDDYLEITTTATLLQQHWRERVSQIITANSAADCRAAYESALVRAEDYGYKDVLRFDNNVFQKLKETWNLKYAWPPLQEGYNPPEVTSIYGNTDYCVEIPDMIPRV